MRAGENIDGIEREIFRLCWVQNSQILCFCPWDFPSKGLWFSFWYQQRMCDTRTGAVMELFTRSQLFTEVISSSSVHSSFVRLTTCCPRCISNQVQPGLRSVMDDHQPDRLVALLLNLTPGDQCKSNPIHIYIYDYVIKTQLSRSECALQRSVRRRITTVNRYYFFVNWASSALIK